MSFATFRLPEWIEAKGPTAVYDLGGSASPPRSIRDLVELSDEPETTKSNLKFDDLKLNYNSSTTGQEALKANIARLFTTSVEQQHILTTAGTSLANQIVLQALLRPGDHVICVQPTYGQLHAVPLALGAELSFWRHRHRNDWVLDLDELDALIQVNTKMIIVNNPNNPMGSCLSDELQAGIIKFAKQHKLMVLADEIFRPLFHSTKSGHEPKSFLDHAKRLDYTDAIVTGSVSKSHSFPGLRLGWIICRNSAILNTCTNLRWYTLNSMSPIDEMIASEALSVRCQGEIKRRNLDTARKGLAVLEDFVNKSQEGQAVHVVEWVKPLASSTTVIRFRNKKTGDVLDDVKLCNSLHERAGVLLVPASLCFRTDTVVARGDDEDMKGWMRISFVLDENYLTEALAALNKFMEQYDEE